MLWRFLYEQKRIDFNGTLVRFTMAQGVRLLASQDSPQAVRTSGKLPGFSDLLRTATMRVIRSKEFTATRAWGADDIANMDGTTVRLHWTDQPYKWHVNDGEEVFAVLDGTVEMHYRESGIERVVTLMTGDVFFAGIGCEHVAHPRGEARILVIEREGSV
jgi:mannose-6-phosphate isomerase-like protein (cupin superfamily)